MNTIAKSVFLLFAVASVQCYAAHYHVYLLGGQSNGNGRADASQLTAPLSETQLDVRLYYLNDQDTNSVLPEEEWINLAPGSGHGSTLYHPVEFGPEVSFGRAMADAKPTANIAIIKYTYGGSNLYSDWSATGARYTTFVSTVQAALSALTAADDTYELRGMLWQQGESDTGSDTAADNYEANLTNLITRVRVDLDGGAALPFVIGSISDSQYTNITTVGSGPYKVRQAQEAVAAADATVGITISDGFVLQSDGIHFDHAAQVDLGQGHASEMLALEVADETAPLLVNKIPEGESSDPVSTNLVADFNEPITLNDGGTVTLRNLGPGTDIVFSLPDTQVIASGSQLIINPSSDLIADNPYAVRISTNAVSDLAGNPYAGIADDTSWNFRLGVPNPVYLIHHWKFDADMNDSAGTHDVTPTGDAARTTGSGGKFGEALVLDGDGDYVTTTVGLSSLPSSDFSLTAWIFRENATNYSSIAGSQNGGSEGAFLRAEPASGGATGTNTLFANLLPDYAKAWGGTGTLPLNQWAHVAMTVSSTTGLTLYIDGFSVASNAAGTNCTPYSVFRIGAPAYTGDRYFFDGLIDDVAIFDHVLDAGQIGNVMTYGADNWTLGTILLSGNTVASNSPPGTLVGSLSFNDDIADEFGLSVTDSGPDSGDFQITGTTNLQTKVWMDSASKAISIIAYSNSTVLATNHFTITVSEATTLPFIVSADVQAGAADGTVIGTAQAAVSEATFSIVGGRSDLFYMDGAELKLTNSADWGSVGTTNYVILQAASGSVSNELVVAAGVGSGATRGMIILVR